MGTSAQVEVSSCDFKRTLGSVVTKKPEVLVDLSDSWKLKNRVETCDKKGAASYIRIFEPGNN